MECLAGIIFIDYFGLNHLGFAGGASPERDTPVLRQTIRKRPPWTWKA